MAGETHQEYSEDTTRPVLNCLTSSVNRGGRAFGILKEQGERLKIFIIHCSMGESYVLNGMPCARLLACQCLFRHHKR